MSTLDATALTTTALVKQTLNISGSGEDNRIIDAINTASAAVHSYCNRTAFTSASYTEYLDGTGTPTLLLRNVPIISITSVNVDGNRDFASATALTVDTDYVADNAEGMLRLLVAPAGFSLAEWPRGIQIIKVVYTAGYATVPTDIERAACDLAAFYYKKRGQRGNKVVSVGGIRTEEDTAGIPQAFRERLDPYTLHSFEDLYIDNAF